MSDDERDKLARAATDAIAPRAALPLASGRRIEVVEGEAFDTLFVRSRTGECVLTVRVTDEGPILSFRGAALEIAAAGELSLSCDDLKLSARRSASIEVGGDLVERVGGNVARETAGASLSSARSIGLSATPGGIAITANDDVAIAGERVRLNSEDPPMPLSWEEGVARRAERLAQVDPSVAAMTELTRAEPAVWVGPRVITEAARDDGEAPAPEGDPAH